MAEAPVSKLVPLDFSYVLFIEGDRWSEAMAFVTFVPIAVWIGVVTLLLFRREIETVYLFAGLTVDSVINLLLKRVLKDPRPLGE